MKKYLFVIGFLILLFSCTKQEVCKKIETPKYDLGQIYDVKVLAKYDRTVLDTKSALVILEGVWIIRAGQELYIYRDTCGQPWFNDQENGYIKVRMID